MQLIIAVAIMLLIHAEDFSGMEWRDWFGGAPPTITAPEVSPLDHPPPKPCVDREIDGFIFHDCRQTP